MRPNGGLQMITLMKRNRAAHLLGGGLFALAALLAFALWLVPDERASAQSQPSVTIEAQNPVYFEGETATFILSRTGSTSNRLTVNVLLTQTGNVLLSNTLNRTATFVAGSATAELSVQLRDNNEFEEDGNTGELTVSVFSRSGYTVGTPRTAEIFVDDDEPPPGTVTVKIAADQAEVSETEESLSFTLTRAITPGTRLPDYPEPTPLSDPLEVFLRIEDGYRLDRSRRLPNNVTFEAGSRTATLTLTLHDDDLDQGDSDVWVEVIDDFDNLFKYIPIEPVEAKTAVLDNDPVVNIEAVKDTVSEDDEEVEFRITRLGPPRGSLDVSVSVTQTGNFVEDYDTEDFPPGSGGIVTIPDGFSAATLYLTVDDDATDEPDGTVTATILPDPNEVYTIGDGSATTVVTDDDESGPRRVMVERLSPSSVSEQYTLVEFKFTIVGDYPGDSVELRYEVRETGGPRIASLSSGTVNTVNTVDFRTVLFLKVGLQGDDDVYEPDSEITVTVLPGTDYLPVTGEGASASITVTENDPEPPELPVVTIETITPVVTEADGYARFRVTRTGGDHSRTMEVYYNLSETGGPFIDHKRNAGFVYILFDNNTAVLNVPLERDESRDPPSVITVTLTNPYPPYKYTLPEDRTATVIVFEDRNSEPLVTVTAPSSAVTEADGTVSFTLTRTGSTSGVLPIGVTVSETGNMLSGTLPTMVTFASGISTSTLMLNLENDRTDEPDSVITVATAQGQSASVTVADNDLPTVSIAAVTSPVSEGAGSVGFSITRVGDNTVALTVNAMIEQVGSADFVANRHLGERSFVIPVGHSSVVASWDLVDDNVIEPDGRLLATLVGSLEGAYTTVMPWVADVRVTDDDTPTITLSAPGTPISEAAGPAVFTLTRAGNTSQALTVNVLVSEDRDMLASQSKPFTATVNFTSGSTTATLSLSLDNDSVDEQDSTITATVQSGNGYFVGNPSSGTVLVTDDDVPPPGTPEITVRAVSSSVSEEVSAVFTLAFSEDTGGALIPTIRLEGAEDFRPTDRPVSMTFDTTARTITVSVPLEDDNVNDADADLTLTVLTGEGYTLGATTMATIAITDND